MNEKIRSLAAIVSFLYLAPLAYGQGQSPAVVFAAPTATVTAGGTAQLWLNALNPTGQPLAWRFPSAIACRLASGTTTESGLLVLQPGADAGRVVIVPGGFARRQYTLAIPISMTGQVMVEAKGLDAGHVVLEVVSAAAAQEEPPPQKRHRDVLTRFLDEGRVEEQTPYAYDPIQFFKDHLYGYEPFYFLAGPKDPKIKFQISFKYQLFNHDGALANMLPALKGVHFAYTQTSLWDVGSASAPFFDSSYMPELLYEWQRVLGSGPDDVFRLDLQGGIRHESNGKGDIDSRSLNIVYVRPTVVLGPDDGFQFTIQPRVWFYVASVEGNPDIADFRGYADLRAIIGWKRGLQLSALGRIGNDGDNESLQLDLTYPLMNLFSHSSAVYAHVQYFTGFGESLLRYNESSSSLRFGVSIFR